jgi:hypothetical protein
MPVEEPFEQLGACYTIGPVANEALARQLSVRLKDRFDALVLRDQSVDLDIEYRVLAAPEPDRQATHRLVARLTQAGITDRFLLPRGDNKGRVSLGVFHDPRKALKWKKILAAKGFAAEIVPRRKTTKHYWLDLSLTAGTVLPGQFQEMATSLTPALSLKPVACSPQLVQR